MSRDFNGTTDVVRATTVPVTTTPYTMSVWLNMDSILESEGVAFSLSNNTNNKVYISIGVVNIETSNRIIGKFRGGASPDSVQSTVPINLGEWVHACVVATSSTNRSLFTNGADKVTTTANVTPTLENTSLGCRYHGSVSDPFNGKIAHASVWNIALTDQEVASLANGINPLSLRPSSLVYYCPCNGNQSSEKDIIGGISHIVTGTTKFNDEPPIDSPIITV